MSISDELADTVAGEQKRWAALAGLDTPLPEVAKNGKLWGSVALGLGLAVMAGAGAVGPVYIKALVVAGGIIMQWRVRWLKYSVKPDSLGWPLLFAATAAATDLEQDKGQHRAAKKTEQKR